MTVELRTNEEIKKDIVDQLFWDSRVDASRVKVEVSKGEVVLSGTVPTPTAREAAAEDAWVIGGVRNVRNQLEIEYPPGVTLPPDAEIKTHILNLLKWQPNVDENFIDVDVNSGQVKLRGTVDALWKKGKVGALASGIIGVQAVTNEIAVVPTRRLSDKAIADEIEAALERHTAIDPDQVELQVEAGIVTLTGQVPSQEALLAIERTAENTEGVTHVENQLKIQ